MLYKARHPHALINAGCYARSRREMQGSSAGRAVIIRSDCVPDARRAGVSKPKLLSVQSVSAPGPLQLGPAGGLSPVWLCGCAPATCPCCLVAAC